MNSTPGYSTATSVSNRITTHDPNADTLTTTMAVDNDPYLSETESDGDVSESEGSDEDTAQHYPISKNNCPMKRTVSESTVQSHGQRRHPSADTVQAVPRFDEESVFRGGHPARFHPKPPLPSPRPASHRSSSTSQVEAHSPSHDPHPARHAVRSTRVGRLRTVSKRVYYTSIARSDPDVSENTTQAREPYPKTAPLKTCLKHKAKSATTSPPSEPQEDGDTSRILRRVKTVDFEEMSKPLLLLASLPIASTEVDCGKTDGSRRTARVRPWCPSTINAKKSALAGPAVTRADVHVIAIAPSCNLDDIPNEEANDPATPTMQIIESTNGCYEVIWADVPIEGEIRFRARRGSSANHSLKAISSTATRGLERVNSKLTDWSGAWTTPSHSFMPAVVVFPDDDGYTPRSECAVDDDDNDMLVYAPPNSQLTSAAPSRLPSRPPSAPLSRVASHDDLSPKAALHEGPPPATQLFPPDPETRPGVAVAAGRRVRSSASARKLSNVEEVDLKFRGHRDSVTIAHSRLIHGGSVSPELFAHRDSVSLAKKRMHARNHASLAGRDVPLV